MIPVRDHFCHCEETIVGGERVPMPHFHNCRYVRARNALLSDAERIATTVTDPSLLDVMQTGPSYAEESCRNSRQIQYGVVWTRNFSDAMEALAKERL